MLQRYFIIKMLQGMIGTWFFIGTVVTIINLIEILARLSDHPDSSFALALKIMLLKAPSNFQLLLPFAVMMGVALALLNMRRGNELIMVMMSGLKQRQLVLWIMMTAVLLSIVALLCDGFVAKSHEQYRLYERNVLSLQHQKFEEYVAGLKFYYETEHLHYYINLHYVNTLSDNLGPMSIIISDKKDGKLVQHITANNGRISANAWRIFRVTLYQPSQDKIKLSAYNLPIIINHRDLVVLARPLDTIGFFALPSFIKLAQNLGAPANLYKIYYWQKAINPLLYASFAILAFGIVRLLSPRIGNGWVILKCFLWALALIFISNLIGALASSEQISLLLAMVSQLMIPLILATIFLMQPGIK